MADDSEFRKWYHDSVNRTAAEQLQAKQHRDAEFMGKSVEELKTILADTIEREERSRRRSDRIAIISIVVALIATIITIGSIIITIITVTQH
jgi:hypothetical protein